MDSANDFYKTGTVADYLAMKELKTPKECAENGTAGQGKGSGDKAGQLR